MCLYYIVIYYLECLGNVLFERPCDSTCGMRLTLTGGVNDERSFPISGDTWVHVIRRTMGRGEEGTLLSLSVIASDSELQSFLLGPF